MAISILRGKTYSIEEGLSSSSGIYFVVGKINAPQKVDNSLGWNNYDNEPSFTSSTFYLVTDATIIITPFDKTGSQTGTDAKFVPSAYIEQAIIEESSEKIPLVIEGPAYSEFHELSTSSNWYVSEIVERPIRIDKTLGWRDPDINRPEFITASCAVCFPAIFSSITESLVPDTIAGSSLVPLFLITKVLQWKEITIEAAPVIGTAGVTGATGPRGFQGLQGFQGLSGATGVTGERGFQGVAGVQGPAGNSTSTGIGPQGPAGINGANGTNGTNGSQGPQGFQGNGPQGPQGTGTNGSQGPQGFQGDQGPQGNQGTNGTNGSQ